MKSLFESLYHIINKLFLLIPFLVIISISKLSGQQLAFPGAEGYGRFASGGRFGKVIEVTNLNDDGVGSFRAALEDTARRIVVFRVSGIINLKSRIKLTSPNITIAGQTAPGDGICLKNYPLIIETNNVIVRFIHFRPGDETQSNNPAIYGLDVENSKNVIIDHCSMSWSIEEAATFYDDKYITVQWCLVGESLNNSFNSKGNHGYGGVWGGQYASYHHNLIADNYSRNPRFNGARAHDTVAVLDYRNNVIFNWGDNSAYGGEVTIKGGLSHINMINNYYQSGPATSSSKKDRIIQPYDLNGRWYINGNFVTGYPKVTADNWNGGVQMKSWQYYMDSVKVDTPFTVAPVITQTAEKAYELVVAQAGASYPHRDSVDLRMINQIKTGVVTDGGSYGSDSGIIDSQTDVGGWPVYNTLPAPVDSDHDGMPDEWETKNGLNPNDPADADSVNNDGYTMVEVYINNLVKSSISGIKNVTKPPKKFNLFQNYPNPFNPSTMIKYKLVKPSKVELNVYDILGRKVATLINSYQNEGIYKINFNAEKYGLNSGVYFYRIQAGNYIITRKMILLK